MLVGDSNIAGKGLFAKKNIKANTIISFYPCHALGVEGTFVVNESDEPYFANQPQNESPYLHCTDQPIFARSSILNRPDQLLYLDVKPSIALENTIWTSHYINDGAMATEATSEAVLQYYKTSSLARNCIHIPFGPSPMLATVTTKKVKKGEEFLTSYGADYWLLNRCDTVPQSEEIHQEMLSMARQLQASMKTVGVTYANHIVELEALYNAIN